MQSLDERLAELRFELKEHQDRAHDEAERAERIRERIAGIEEARAVLQPQAGNGAEPPRRHRERRDIKALVRAELSEPRPEGSQPSPEAIALRIGCRPSQVRRALGALRRDKDLEG